MAIFSLVGTSLFLWFVWERFGEGGDRLSFLKKSLMGALFCTLFVPVLGIFHSLFSDSIEGWNVFFRGVIVDLGLPLCSILCGYILFYRKQIILPLQAQWERFIAFGSGGILPAAVFGLAWFQGWEEGLQYILLPFLWIQLIILGGAILGILFSSYRSERYLSIGVGLGWLFLLGWFVYLYRNNIRLLSWALILGSFILFVFLFPKVKNRLQY